MYQKFHDEFCHILTDIRWLTASWCTKIDFPIDLRIFYRKIEHQMSMGKCSQYPEPARTMRKDKLYFFVDYIFDIGMHLPGRREWLQSSEPKTDSSQGTRKSAMTIVELAWRTRAAKDSPGRGRQRTRVVGGKELACLRGRQGASVAAGGKLLIIHSYASHTESLEISKLAIA